MASPKKSGAANSESLDPKMLELLVCPQTKTPLHYDSKKRELISKEGKRVYRVQGGVPILLISHSRPMDEEGESI